MSLTLAQEPNYLFEPVYTPFYFRLTSSLSNQPDFKYVFEIYTIDQLTTVDSDKLATVKLFPRGDSSGVFTPARILENYVSYDFSPFGSGFTTSPNSVVLYKIKFGEEYTVTGYTFSSITNNGGLVQYNFNSAPGFLAGDTIKIEKTYKNYNLYIDGLQEITAVSGADITTDKSYADFVSGYTESGECISRLTIQTASTKSGMAVNFAKQYLEKDTNFGAQYILTGTGSNFMQQLEGKIRIDWNNEYTLGAQQNFAVGVTGGAIFTYSGDSVSDLIGIHYIAKGSSLYTSIDFRCGTANLAGITDYNYWLGTNTLILPSNTTRYLVTLVSGATLSASTNVTQSKEFLITPDAFCGYETIRLAWLNRLGKWSYQNFNMIKKRKVETNRTYISNLLDYDYSIGDSQTKVLGTATNEIYQMNTTYLWESEANDLETLWTSPTIFWLKDGVALPFVILSKEFNEQTYKNDGLIQFTIEGRLGYEINLQRN